MFRKVSAVKGAAIVVDIRVHCYNAPVFKDVFKDAIAVHCQSKASGFKWNH